MNYARIALASLGAMVAYFVYGFAMFAAWPPNSTAHLSEEACSPVPRLAAVSFFIRLPWPQTRDLTAATDNTTQNRRANILERLTQPSATCKFLNVIGQPQTEKPGVRFQLYPWPTSFKYVTHFLFL